MLAEHRGQRPNLQTPLNRAYESNLDAAALLLDNPANVARALDKIRNSNGLLESAYQIQNAGGYRGTERDRRRDRVANKRAHA